MLHLLCSVPHIWNTHLIYHSYYLLISTNYVFPDYIKVSIFPGGLLFWGFRCTPTLVQSRPRCFGAVFVYYASEIWREIERNHVTLFLSPIIAHCILGIVFIVVFLKTKIVFFSLNVANELYIDEPGSWGIARK